MPQIFYYHGHTHVRNEDGSTWCLSNEWLGEKTVELNEQLIQQINAVIETSKKVSSSLNRGPGGRENALVTTKLQEAFHWALETRWQLTGIDPTSTNDA
jgi:hypothetical protein